MTVQDYKKLLPKAIRTTRWGELIEAVQSVLEDIRVNKIDIIKTQYNLEQMTDEQLIDIAYIFGYVINSFEGYTSETEYLKKEVLTLIPRILNRTTRPGYQFIFYIYNLIGNIYPMYKEDVTNYLIPLETWWESNENPATYDTLDAGADFILFRLLHKIDSDLELDNSMTTDMSYEISRSIKESVLTNTTLDTDIFPSLDMDSYLDNLTRHIVINYQFRFCEDANTFISDNTLLALYEDMKIQKRKTEVLYYEPNITIETNDDNSLTTDIIYNFDHSINTTRESILIGTDLLDVSKIRFGNGSHAIIDGTITDVNHLVTSIDIADWDDKSLISTEFKGRRIITQKNTFNNFTEIALLDSGSNCLYYATFPEIRYLSKMYSNIYIYVNLI